MSDKPSFIGLLNAIAVAEGQAEQYLVAWADTTDNDDVAEVLRFVALREGEHARAFALRLADLGFSVREKDDPTARARIEIAESDSSDVEKFEKLELNVEPGDTDVFDSMFSDKTIDPVTGALLGRYIAEERDSVRRLRACYRAISAS